MHKHGGSITHESGNRSQIYDKDPCHKFAWCMDACIGGGSFELRRIKEVRWNRCLAASSLC